MKIALFFGKGMGYEAPAYRQAGVSVNGEGYVQRIK
jgi:hypothetical protein